MLARGRSPRAVARPAGPGRARRTATVPGRLPFPAVGGSPCALTWCPRLTATTGTRRTATSRAAGFVTWSRSATARVPSRPATGTPASRTSSTPSLTTRAAGPARATPGHAAVPATASSSHLAGRSPSHDQAGTSGRPRPAASTCRNPSGIRLDLGRNCLLIKLSGWTARSSGLRASQTPHRSPWCTFGPGRVPTVDCSRRLTLTGLTRRSGSAGGSARWPSDSVGRAGVLVAEAGGALLGFASYSASRDSDADPARVGEIGAIYLLPSTWGKGVGRRLMDVALACLAEAEFVQVTLWVLESNARARRFYAAGGWSADGTRKLDESRGFPIAQVRYRRSLTSSRAQPG